MEIASGRQITRLAFALLGGLALTAGFLYTAAAGPAPTNPRGAGVFFEVRRFSGHKDCVWSAIFSPDGRKVLSGSYDRTVRLWDVATGKELVQIADLPAPVMAIAFLPNGESCVCCCSDGSAHICDLKSRKQIGHFQAHDGSANSLDISADGKTLVTGGADGLVKIWEGTTGKEKRTLIGSTDWIWSVALSPDGKQVLGGGADKTARLWDVATGKELAQLGGHKDSVNSVAFSPNGKEAVTGSNDGEVRVWTLEGGQLTKHMTGHKTPIYSVLYSREGRHAFSAGADGVIRAWEGILPESGNGGMVIRNRSRRSMMMDAYGNPIVPDGGKELRRYEGHDGAVYHLALARDGRSLLSSGRDGTIRLWETRGIDSGLHEFSHPGPVHVAAFLNNGNRVVTVSMGMVRAWDTDRGVLASQIPLQNPTTVTRPFDGTVVESAPAQSYLNQVSRLPSNNQMAVLNSLGSLFVVNADSAGRPRMVDLPRTKGQFLAAILSRDGKEIITGDSEGKLVAWDVATGKEKRSKHLKGLIIGALAIAGNDRDLLAATWRDDDNGKVADVVIRRLDRGSFKELRTYQGHKEQVSSLAFAADGLTFLSGSRDGTVRWWGLETNGKTQVFAIPGGPVTAVAFVDNERFVSAGTDHAIRLWKLMGGAELQRFEGHQGAITGVAFLPGKNLLLSASLDGTARLWKLGTEQVASPPVATKTNVRFGKERAK